MTHNKFWMGIYLVAIGLTLTACNVGERIAEEAVEQALGEGVLATTEAFTGAVATEVVAFATEEASGTFNESSSVDSTNSTESEAEAVEMASEEVAEPVQNDANSGQDAGLSNDPLTISAGTGYPGLITGVQNGGDIFDVYQFETEPGQIVRILVTAPAENETELTANLGNGDGYDFTENVMAGQSAELVMGSANPSRYTLNISHGGLSDALDYTFDLVIESENDAETATDAGNEVTDGLRIDVGTPVRGVSIGNETGANDTDCYTFNQPSEDGAVTVNLSAPVDQPYESFTRAEIYDPAGAFVNSGTAEYGGSYSIEYGIADYESAAPGDYTVCIESYSNYAYGAYEFTVTLK